MLTQALPALCLLIFGLGCLILAFLASRAPDGKETRGVGFQRLPKK